MITTAKSTIYKSPFVGLDSLFLPNFLLNSIFNIDVLLAIKANLVNLTKFTQTNRLKTVYCTLFLVALNISLFPGGPGKRSTTNPTSCMALLTLPFAE